MPLLAALLVLTTLLPRGALVLQGIPDKPARPDPPTEVVLAVARERAERILVRLSARAVGLEGGGTGGAERLFIPFATGRAVLLLLVWVKAPILLGLREDSDWRINCSYVGGGGSSSSNPSSP